MISAIIVAWCMHDAST